MNKAPISPSIILKNLQFCKMMAIFSHSLFCQTWSDKRIDYACHGQILNLELKGAHRLGPVIPFCAQAWLPPQPHFCTCLQSHCSMHNRARAHLILVITSAGWEQLSWISGLFAIWHAHVLGFVNYATRLLIFAETAFISLCLYCGPMLVHE